MLDHDFSMVTSNGDILVFFTPGRSLSNLSMPKQNGVLKVQRSFMKDLCDFIYYAIRVFAFQSPHLWHDQYKRVSKVFQELFRSAGKAGGTTKNPRAVEARSISETVQVPRTPRLSHTVLIHRVHKNPKKAIGFSCPYYQDMSIYCCLLYLSYVVCVRVRAICEAV